MFVRTLVSLLIHNCLSHPLTALNYRGGEAARMAAIEVIKRALKSMLRDALRTEIRKRVSELSLKQVRIVVYDLIHCC